MTRPVGVTIVAALFLVQALYILARTIERHDSVPTRMLLVAIGATALPALTAVGLLRMRKWGRTLAVSLCGLMIVTGLWLRAAGAAPEAVLPIMLVAGTILVYLFSSPARSALT